MIQECHELTERLVHTMTNRVRDYITSQQQSEKLMALGKISAGLAHELNNPASAVVRSSMELKKNLSTVTDKFKKVMSVSLSVDQVTALDHILFSKVSQGMNKHISLLEKTELEDEILDWIEEKGIEDADDIVENLVDFNFREEDLDNIFEKIPTQNDLAPVLAWLNNVLNTEKLVGEIEEAAKRISNLVSSVKSYSHMDKSADKQYVDIHEGIRNTIMIFKHKFKENHVNFVENFQEDLPKVKVWVGELNQVWTNLIDNALDAMAEEGGNLEIKTFQDESFVRIYLSDTGKGIPQEIISKIFDPFFTTKDIGKGTGLGLDAVLRIIQKHNADIKVESKPGNTVFKLCFPIDG